MAACPEIRTADPPPDPKTVIVVEDDPAVRQTAAEAFRSLGAAVLEAYNGADALRLLAEHPEAALVFADVRMAGLSGVDVAYEAQRVWPGVKIALTSGIVRDPPMPGVPFLRKPWRLADLAALIEA